MDVTTQLSGLEELLAVIYGEDTRLSLLLRELGFGQYQVDQLQNGQLETVVTQLLDVIHKRLTSDSGKDTYYQILSRRYGLDGEPRQQLSAIAEKYGYSPEYLRQLFEEILHRCQSKTWQAELKKSLKYIAVHQLGTMQERPTRDHVAEKLERLSNLRNAAEFTRLDYETKRTQILKQVQTELDALDSEYKPVKERVEENIASLENEIKTDVLLHGESISGGMYRAIYTQGRVSWDNEGINRYAESHPDVLQFRKQGQPIVSLRVINKD
jgi:DNA-directed RNA polymerase sigma subunit (sigma70/sigma32)